MTDCTKVCTKDSTKDELAIEMIGATKRFRSTLAVDAVSLAVPRGSILGFIGLLDF